MPTKYYELTEVEGFDGRLFVYKRTVDANVWNFRANIDGVRGYIRHSTKQANLTLTISEAKNGYIELIRRQRQHLTILKTKFDDVFTIWLKDATCKALVWILTTKAKLNWWNRYHLLATTKSFQHSITCTSNKSPRCTQSLAIPNPAKTRFLHNIHALGN